MPGMHNKQKKKKKLYLTLLFKHAWNAQHTTEKKKKCSTRRSSLNMPGMHNIRQKKKKNALPDAPL